MEANKKEKICDGAKSVPICLINTELNAPENEEVGFPSTYTWVFRSHKVQSLQSQTSNLTKFCLAGSLTNETRDAISYGYTITLPFEIV